MNSRFLLDTSAVIALFAQVPAVREYMVQANEVFVPSIVLGELYFGAQNSARPEMNLTRIDAFAESSAVLDCDSETARLYGQIKRHLQARGRPLPQNDIWIAAVAQQYNLTLVTRDNHFTEVDGLLLAMW
jgi:tRNA(fMet)-specific endonuclease VapC